MTHQWLSGPVWDGARLTPKLFVATSTALLLISVLAMAASRAAPWSFVVAGAAVAYVVLMRSAMTEGWSGARHSRTVRLAVGIICLELFLLVVALAVQGVAAAHITVVVAVVLLVMAIVCGVLYLFQWFVGRALPRLLGIELTVAVAHARRGRYTMAVEDARRYAERKPDSPWGWTVSAGALLGLGRTEEALAEADRAVALGGKDYARIVRGVALNALGLYGEACADLRALSQESRALGGPAYGSALIAARRLDDAIAHLANSATSTLGLVDTVLLGETYRLLQDRENATSAYEEAVRRATVDPPGDLYAGMLGWCLAVLGRIDEARRTAEAALARRADDSAAQSAIALVAMLQGDTDEAHDAFRRMLTTSPSAALQSLTDPLFTPLLGEERFRELLAWALGAQQQTRERVRERLPHLFS